VANVHTSRASQNEPFSGLNTAYNRVIGMEGKVP
jgi:hypothetical protein